MASNFDPARFRHCLQENYEKHWFNVSTLKHSLNPGLKRVIANIHTEFEQLGTEVTDLLTQLHICSQIDAINNKYFSIKRIGDRDTWQQIEHDIKLLDDVVSGIKTDDIVVCMVEVVCCKENHEFPHQKEKRKEEEIVKKNFKIEVSKPSLLLLKTILSFRPENVEIVILSGEGIHATDAKSIVFKTLKEMDTKIPETMHHAAETDIEEIVEQRVIAALHNIRMTAQSLLNSFPEIGLIVHYITFAFDNKASQAHISTVATNLDLTVGNTHIGSVQDGLLLVENKIRIREIEYALIKNCQEKIVDEIKTDIQNDISNHIVNELQAKVRFKGSLEKVFDGLVQSLGWFFGSLIGRVFFDILCDIYNSMFRILSPVDVNDPEWRKSCVDVVYDKLQEKKSSMVSHTSRFMDQKFSLYSLKLQRFLITFPPDSKFRYSLRYDESTYEQHMKMKQKCELEFSENDIKLLKRKHVKKIVIGDQETATIYVAKEAEAVTKIQIPSHGIKLQVIRQRTKEDICIFNFVMRKKPKIPSETGEEMKRIISATAKGLFTLHSNLVVIGPSPVKSSQFGENIEERPCIVFVCIGKGFKPLGEPWYPKTLHGIDIDVREGYFNQSVCTRCSVGGSVSTGSWGFLANKIGNKSKKGIITAAHVVVEKDMLHQSIQFQKNHVSAVALEVFSPSDVDSEAPKEKRMYGKVSDIHFGKWEDGQFCVGVDAAFVEKQRQTPVEVNSHINAGTLSRQIVPIDEDLYSTVIKCGRTTARTSGILISLGTVCKCQIDPFYDLFSELKNQYLIESNEVFIKPGDSGCGVYLEKQGNYHPIGIAHASGTADGKTCYVTPIKYVLEALDLEME